MIDIYTEKKESKDWIIQNDLYFNLNTGNEEMTQNEKELIQQWMMPTNFRISTSKQSMDWVPFVIYLLDVRRCSIL